MKILVFVKQVIDTSVPLDVDYVADTVKWSDAGSYMLNPADGWAVQRAVRLKQELGRGTVTAVSFGPERVVRALRECIALGADDAIRVDNSDFREPQDALGISSVLSKVVDDLGPDLVICGTASADVGMRSLGPVLAAMKNLPHVPDVVDFEAERDGQGVVAQRQLPKGDRESVRCPLPALLTLTARTSASYASLPMAMRAMRARVQTLEAKDLVVSNHEVATSLSATRLVKVSLPRPRPKKIFMPNSNLPPEERLKQLLAGGPSRQKPTNFVEGSAGDVAARAIEFMEQQKLL